MKANEVICQTYSSSKRSGVCLWSRLTISEGRSGGEIDPRVALSTQTVTPLNGVVGERKRRCR